MGIKQPSVLKIERQTDLYLSTLRRFVEAGASRGIAGQGGVALKGLGELKS
jgi:hypothetical protein